MSINTTNSEFDERFMRQALAEAEAAYEAGEVPVGAVVVAEGSIIGRGHNQVEQLGDPTAHAEMIALTAAADHYESWRLLGAHLFVTIEPCAMCAGAAVLARVERIVFGARDPKFGACGSIFNIPAEERLNHRMAVGEGVLAEQAEALMVSFFRERRRKEKGETDE
ncbi:tRNA adenosine(34) deaminase TadA [Candidatus Zixiibacteriota bacterium]